jgi:hypothetical protein
MFAVITVEGNKKLTIPSKYANFENLFKEEKGKKTLLKY